MTTTKRSEFIESLRLPAVIADRPQFQSGWLTPGGDEKLPFLNCTADAEVNWSDELEAFHEESTRHHFIDIWTRTAVIDQVLPDFEGCDRIAELGCSTGYMLEDLRNSFPHSELIGVDMIASGLSKAHQAVPGALLFLADMCDLPFEDGCMDVVVSLNALEHIPDDIQALGEIKRILRPGGLAVIVVPYGPNLYDDYDTYLGHERRYARKELAGKAREAGLAVQRDFCIGSLLYPAFWTVKKLKRIRSKEGTIAQAKIHTQKSINKTQSSKIGGLICGIERRLLHSGVNMPLGIRCVTVLQNKIDKP